MSDPVLAAIIAAAATILTSFLQLRLSVGRELAAARAQTAGGKRKGGRAPIIVLFIMLVAAAVGGFSLARWLTEGERETESNHERELRAEIDQITRTASQLEMTRTGARAEIEGEVLRRMGIDGIVVMATVSPCRPALVVNPPGTTSPPGVAADAAPPPALPCSEAEANTVALCATVPGKATVGEIELYARIPGSDDPWTSSRVMPGQESSQARFAPQSTEKPDASGSKQVCQAFSQWDSGHARDARIVVHYSM